MGVMPIWVFCFGSLMCKWKDGHRCGDTGFIVEGCVLVYCTLLKGQWHRWRLVSRRCCCLRWFSLTPFTAFTWFSTTKYVSHVLHTSGRTSRQLQAVFVRFVSCKPECTCSYFHTVNAIYSLYKKCNIQHVNYVCTQSLPTWRIRKLSSSLVNLQALVL